MLDHITPTQRSYNMSRIKGEDTLLELKVRKYLFQYRKIVKDLPGTPNIVLDRYRVVAFGIVFLGM